MMLKTLPALAALAVAAALVVPTVSAAEEVPSARVSYADLNLLSSVGQQKLQFRIADAAKSVCGIADARAIGFAHAVADCRTAAIADAQPAFELAIAGARHPSVTVLDESALVVSAR